MSHTIVIAVNAFRPGGSQTYALELANALDDHGISVAFVGKKGSWLTKFDSRATTVPVLWREGSAADAVPLWKRAIFVLCFPINRIRLRRAVRRVDMVIASEPGPVAYMARVAKRIWSGASVFALVHGTGTAEWPFVNHGKTVAALDGLFAATPEVLDMLNTVVGREKNRSELGNLFSAKRYWKNSNSEIGTQFDPTGPILFLGTLTPNKVAPLETLIQYSALRPVQICVVGDGSSREHLEGLARKLDVADRIEWVGSVPDPRHWLIGASLVITGGRGALESLSIARPTIVATSDGIHGLVTSDSLNEVRQFNFTGRTPSSHSPNDLDWLTQSIDAARRLSLDDRIEVSRMVESVGSIAPVLTALKENI